MRRSDVNVPSARPSLANTAPPMLGRQLRNASRDGQPRHPQLVHHQPPTSMAPTIPMAVSATSGLGRSHRRLLFGSTTDGALSGTDVLWLIERPPDHL
jgi:hypothetical protein